MLSERFAIEYVVCGGAFASVILLKFLISRADKSGSFLTVEDKANDRKSGGVRKDEKSYSASGNGDETPEGKRQTSSSSRHQELLPVIGLDNLGNTCYLNSLIQAVVCIPEFLVWLENSRGGVTSSPVSHGRAVLGQPGLGSARLRFRKYGLSSTQKHVRKFFHALVRLVQVLDHRLPVGGGCFAASSLISAMFDGMGAGIHYYQQDPDELFLFMIASLSRVWDGYRFPCFTAAVFGGEVGAYCSEKMDHQNTPRTVELHADYVSRDLKPWVTQPFQGLLYQDLLCVVCKKARPQPLEVFNGLSLSLPANRVRGEVYMLEDLLKKYFVPDDLDAVECTYCGKDASTDQGSSPKRSRHTPHLKRTSIARLPRILCIHIRRTVWSGTDSCKRRDPVSFSGTLSMNDFSWSRHVGGEANGYHQLLNRENLYEDAENGSNGKLWQSRLRQGGIYGLKSVIVHVGESSSRGHIVAYRKGPVGSINEDCWYYTSDCVVRQTSWAEVQTADPYILFFEKRR